MTIDLTSRARARSDYALELLEHLVAEPSVEGSAAIERCLDIVQAEVEPFATELIRPETEGLTSLIARFGDSGRAPELAFSGHVDVVPAEGEWTSSPFELTRCDGRLRGRGACDMKAGVAAFVAAISSLRDEGVLDAVSLELVLTGDEEVGSRRGLLPLLGAGLVRAPRAVCGEPTGLDVFLGNRGLIWVEVTITGAGGHAGLVHGLANPLEPAVALATRLHQLPLDARDERFDPPSPSLTVTAIEGGASAINIVPDSATVRIDRRLLPGEDVEAARDQIVDVAHEVAGPPYSCRVETLREWPPYAIPAESPTAQAARRAVTRVGLDGPFDMDLASNDSSWLDQAGIETVLLGPGDPGQAHTTDEQLDLQQLLDAVVVYSLMAQEFATKPTPVS